MTEERAESGARSYKEGPTYQELLQGYMSRADVEGKEKLWRLFEERSPWVFEREPFELCYEGTWPNMDPRFCISLEYVLGIEESETLELFRAFMDRNPLVKDLQNMDQKTIQTLKKWKGRPAARLR